MNSWSDPTNAEIYDAFARKHPMYRETTMDLVKLAAIQGSQAVVDLACGTGVSTEVILSRLDKDGRVVAIDGSEAMLQVARERVHDERVQFVHADASDVAAHARKLMPLSVTQPSGKRTWKRPWSPVPRHSGREGDWPSTSADSSS